MIELTLETIEELRRLEREATPGEWHVTTCGDYWIEHEQPIGPADDEFTGVAHCGDIQWPNHQERQTQWEANARLLALARNALPALLDAAEAHLRGDWRPIETADVA